MTSPRLLAPTANFAFNLLKGEVADNAGKNVIVSPLCASMALGLTASGARGKTLKGMNKALGLPDYGDADNKTNSASYANLLADLKGSALGVKLSIANAIWANEGVEFADAFLTGAVKNFKAQVNVAPFDAEALEAINRWVNLNTNGKIDKILEEMARDAAMYLLNALYFKGTWTNQFDKSLTEDLAFHAPDGEKKIPTMFRGDKMRYSDQGDYQVVALPFGEAKRVHLYVLLPAEGKTAAQVAAGLEGDKFLKTCREELYESEGSLWLPRFKLDYKAELNKTLKALGMEDAFASGADFTGMRSENDLSISRVIHKVVASFDEEGGELAAATAVEMVLECMGPMPWEMRVDRPFVAVLADEETGAIIGSGVVVNP